MFSVHVDDVTDGIRVKPKSVLPVLSAEPTVDHQFQEVSRMPCDLLNVTALCDLVQTVGMLFDAFLKQVAYDGNPYVPYFFTWTLAKLFVKTLLLVAQSLHAPRSVSHLKWTADHDCCPFPELPCKHRANTTTARPRVESPDVTAMSQNADRG
jgi:hypothetical protein